MGADIALMTWIQMVSNVPLSSATWTILMRTHTQATDSVTRLDKAWERAIVRPGRLKSILGGCRPRQVSRSCFRNLLCKASHSQATQTHGWQQFRASYLLLQELFSDPQGWWAQTEAPRTCNVHGAGRQGAVLYTAVKWADSVTGLDSPLYLLECSPSGLWR